MKNIKYIFLLHFLLMFYSLSGLFCKKASAYGLLEYKFYLNYGMVFVLLGIYAIVWQQIIKKIPLTIAYSNKSITILWNMIWGLLFFGESIKINNIIGVFLIILGIILFSSDLKEKDNG